MSENNTDADTNGTMTAAAQEIGERAGLQTSRRDVDRFVRDFVDRVLETESLALNEDERERLLEERLAACGAEPEPSPYPFMTWVDVQALAGMGFDVAPHTPARVAGKAPIELHVFPS